MVTPEAFQQPATVAPKEVPYNADIQPYSQRMTLTCKIEERSKCVCENTFQYEMPMAAHPEFRNSSMHHIWTLLVEIVIVIYQAYISKMGFRPKPKLAEDVTPQITDVARLADREAIDKAMAENQGEVPPSMPARPEQPRLAQEAPPLGEIADDAT